MEEEGASSKLANTEEKHESSLDFSKVTRDTMFAVVGLIFILLTIL